MSNKKYTFILPCQDCIAFPICKARVQDCNGLWSVVITLKNICSIYNSFSDEVFNTFDEDAWIQKDKDIINLFELKIRYVRNILSLRGNMRGDNED